MDKDLSIADVREKPKEVLRLAKDNEGTWDMVVQLSLGLCGDPLCHKLLDVLYPQAEVTPSHQMAGQQLHADVTTYHQMAGQLLEAAWSSKRRNYKDGVLYCIMCLGESLLYEEYSGKLKTQLASPCNTLNIGYTPCYLNSVLQFLRNISEYDRFSDVVIGGMTEAGSVLSTQGTTGVSMLLLQYTSDTTRGFSHAISGSTTLKRLLMASDKRVPLSAWDGYRITHNSSIECLGVGVSMVDGKLAHPVCTQLDKLRALHTLWFAHTELGCEGWVSTMKALSALPKLKHLAIINCGLCTECLPAVIELMLNRALLWLDISKNDIGDKGAAILADGLRDRRCELTVLRMYEVTSVGYRELVMAIRGCKSLKYWDILLKGELSSNCREMLDYTDFTDLSESSLTQLYLPNLYYDREPDVLRILPTSTHLTWLGFYESYFGDEQTNELLIQALTQNHTLQALSMVNCGALDYLVHKLSDTLSRHHTLKLLDLSSSDVYSLQPIVSLICNSRLQHLGIACIDLESDGWTEVGRALAHSKHMVSCWVGTRYKTKELGGFIQAIQAIDGRLKHVIVRGVRSQLATEDLPKCVRFARNCEAFYVLSGLWYRDFSADHTRWLTNAHLD